MHLNMQVSKCASTQSTLSRLACKQVKKPSMQAHKQASTPHVGTRAHKPTSRTSASSKRARNYACMSSTQFSRFNVTLVMNNNFHNVYVLSICKKIMSDVKNILKRQGIFCRYS